MLIGKFLIEINGLFLSNNWKTNFFFFKKSYKHVGNGVASHIIDKGFVSRIYKGILQLNKKTITGTGVWLDTSSEMTF